MFVAFKNFLIQFHMIPACLECLWLEVSDYITIFPAKSSFCRYRISTLLRCSSLNESKSVTTLLVSAVDRHGETLLAGQSKSFGRKKFRFVSLAALMFFPGHSRAEIRIHRNSFRRYLVANTCSVSEFGRIRIPPGQHHLLRQLGMVRLELGWGFCKTNNDCVDRRGDQTKQGGAQDKADSCSDEKGTGNDRSVLLH